MLGNLTMHFCITFCFTKKVTLNEQKHFETVEALSGAWLALGIYLFPGLLQGPL